MAVILEARNLRVDYGAFTALRGFNLQLESGQLLGLVGPNGAGKTTALRSLAGLQPLTTGEVSVLGEAVEAGNTAALSQIGFTPDNPGLYEALTVEQFLIFVGKSYGLTSAEIEERIGFWLDQLWLTERRTWKVSTLSRGMKQRLGVARTLLPNPSLILLDEPAAGLDPAGRVQFRKMLSSLRDQGKALIVSSHILADLHEYCTHIAIMEGGAVRSFGTVAAFVDGDGTHRGRYRARLITVPADLEKRMKSMADVASYTIDSRGLEIEYERGDPAAARLLRALIAHGLEVTSFEPLDMDLEAAYLRTGIRQVD